MIPVPRRLREDPINIPPRGIHDLSNVTIQQASGGEKESFQETADWDLGRPSWSLCDDTDHLYERCRQRKTRLRCWILQRTYIDMKLSVDTTSLKGRAHRSDLLWI
jgi:hypothetical protein